MDGHYCSNDQYTREEERELIANRNSYWTVDDEDEHDDGGDIVPRALQSLPQQAIPVSKDSLTYREIVFHQYE